MTTMGKETGKEPMGKDDIRKLIRQKRRELDPVWIEQKSLVAERTVMELPEFKNAGVVGCYLAMEYEVRTDRILERCWKEGKTVCVPAYSRKDGKYRLSKLGHETPIIEGSWKVWEPAHLAWVAPGKLDVIIVPGMAFDRFCGRLGHGGGHYDKILGAQPPKSRHCMVGLAFDFQVLDSVPMSKSDVRMDIVVTEKKLIRSDEVAC